MDSSSEVVSSALEQRLVADHRRLEDALETLIDLLASEDAVSAASLWSDFERRLLAHMRAGEQTIVFMVLKARPPEARVLAAEHNHLRTRMGDLRSAVGRGTLREIDVTSFLHELRAHMRPEEAILYRFAVEQLDSPALRALDEALDPLEPW